MRKLKSRAAGFVLAVIMAAGTVSVPVSANTFSDVQEEHWAYSYVERAAAEGAVNGVGNGMYAPSNTLTRAEFLVMLTRAFFPTYVEQTAASLAGTTTTWYTANCVWADKLGLTDGTSFEDGLHTAVESGSGMDAVVSQTITRFDMAAVAYNVMRYCGVPDVSNEQRDAAYMSIPDNIPSEYRGMVCVVYARGVINGVDAVGTFNGEGVVDRAQAATIYCRVADVVKAEGFAEFQPIISGSAGEEQSGLTEQQVYDAIIALKKDYPEGKKWNNDNTYKSDAMNSRGGGCEAFALICSDAAFGDLPLVETHSDFDRIRVGDILRTNNNTHTVIVLEKNDSSVVVAEGNYNNSIHWGRTISQSALENEGFYVRTRWSD